MATSAPTSPPAHGRGYLLVLSLTALGVVFGDIGTSPLYAMKEAFHGAHGIAPTHDNVLGVLSLVFWSLLLIVSGKYLAFVLRADNEGEGGILALMALIHPESGQRGDTRQRVARRVMLVSLGIFGAALLYGDGLITPAISTLSAVEGIQIVRPDSAPLVIPITVAILIGIFMLQRRGTAAIGSLYGPVMLIWFATLAVLGIRGILLAPEVLAAVDPRYGIRFLAGGGLAGYLVLGAVFLVVTGCESMYADMGHFGRKPIRLVWFVLVLPCLLLNYFGQGALLLTDPSAAANPFFHLAPRWALVPLVILAGLAAVIASQALISGAFSLTAQAVQLGYFPRVGIRQTSAHQQGQIYVPVVNWALMIGCILIVLEFGSSSKLAAAYGIAIGATMIITTILLFVVARDRWKWPAPAAAVVCGSMLVAEFAFLGANAVKIAEGGWFPLAFAAGMFILMTTWRDGREILARRLRERSVPLDDFLAQIEKRATTRVRGHAVYMTGNPSVAPAALVQNLNHNRVLHMRVALLSIITEDVPHVPRQARVDVQPHASGFYRVVARYGFMDEPDAIDILRLMRDHHADFPLHDTTFFVGRERLISTDRPGMARWRERLFGFMSSNAQQATAYFRIPPDRVIEVGSQVEI